MKTRIILILAIIASVAFTGCNNALDSEGVSKVTQYPTFDIAGGQYQVIVKGTPFTEKGATTVEGYEVKTVGTVGSAYIDPAHTQPEDVTYSDAVDTDTPGMYITTFSSVNPQGFAGTIDRYIFVVDQAPDPDVDLSGHYTSGSSPAADITKITDGIFYSTNAWGGGSTVVIGAYLICVDGVNIQVPQQESLVRIFGYGKVSGTTLNLKMSRPTFGPPPLLNSTKVWVKA